MERRHLLKDDSRNVVESPVQLFERVAEHIAAAAEYSGGCASVVCA